MYEKYGKLKTHILIQVSVNAINFNHDSRLQKYEKL